jgi:hypothetical protein
MVVNNNALIQVRDASKDKIAAIFVWLGVGDDDTAPTIGDVALGNEFLRVERFEVDTSVSDEVLVNGEVGFGEANGEIIREFGWFEVNVAGDLLSRDVLVNEILKTSDISVVLPKRFKISVIEV